MKIIEEKDILKETKRRIKDIVSNIDSFEGSSDGMIVNGTHTIRFTIKSKTGILYGNVAEIKT